MTRFNGITSPAFRKWIASQPCMICGQMFISQAAHIGKGGMAIKGCDKTCRPLCADTPNRQGCHAKWDQGIIKPPQELIDEIINAPVYYYWQRKDDFKAKFFIVRYRHELSRYK